MKIKVNDLSGIKLDYYVAIAIGIRPEINNHTSDVITYRQDGSYHKLLFNPTSNWTIAGKIIEDNNISIEIIYKENNEITYMSNINYGRPWHYEHFVAVSNNMLEAAMRCFVKSKLGNEVDDIEW